MFAKNRMYESPFELCFVPLSCVSVLLLLLHCHRCYNFISFKSTNPIMCDFQTLFFSKWFWLFLFLYFLLH